MIQQGSNMSFDLHFSQGSSSFHEQKGDHIERAKQQIKILEAENQELIAELKYIKANPHEIIKVFQAKLMTKITQLREENEGIESLIEKSKIPGYAQMTKKKTSYLVQTPGKSMKKDDEEWGDFEKKNPFDDIQMSEKHEVSTCQNFPIQPQAQNPLHPLQPLQNNQLKARAQITMQLLQVIDRTSQITQQMQQIEQSQLIQPQQNINSIMQNGRKIEQISKYKQKLLHLLKKIKAREANQQQIVRQYQKLHEETFQKFKQATQLLNLLGSSANDGQNLDDLYAEVLQLEEKLKYINEQLEKLDETQWLKDIQAELFHALKRLGINLPAEFKNSTGPLSNQALRQRIDMLAQILIQCALNHRADEKQKLTLLKLYYEQQKQNNKKVIKSLQNKQQGLSKKLIDLQMNN